MSIRYKIKSYSSQHSNYPISNLLSKNSHWQSERFCEYPQQITISFYQAVQIDRIKIVSHPTKIANRINILYYLPSHQDEGFVKYGFVTFSDNKQSGYSAKEIKQINEVGIKATEIRLIILKNHQNLNNFFNQVAIDSLTFQGASFDHLMPSQTFQNKSFSLNFIEANLNLLQQFKQNFVKTQQYDAAKQIKQVLNFVNKVGSKLNELQNEKKRFIKDQDYMGAKRVRDQMQKMKQKTSFVVNNFYDPQKKILKSIKSDTILRQKIESLNILNDKSAFSEGSEQARSRIKQNEKAQNQFLRNEVEVISEGEEEPNDIIESRISHDERVVPALMNKIKGGQSQNLEQSEVGQNEFLESSKVEVLPDQPESLSPSNQANSSHLLEFYEPMLIRKLHSKFWQFKFQAISQCIQECKTSKTGRISKNKLRAYIFIYCHTIRSANYQIANAAIQLMSNIVTLNVEGEYKSELFNELEKTFILTLRKLNDSNQKIRTATQKTMFRIIESPVFGPQICYHSLIKSWKQKSGANLRKLKVQGLEHLVQKYSIGQKGVPISIVDFAVRVASDQSSDVRKGAINLLKTVKNKGGKQRFAIVVNSQIAVLKQSVLKELGE